jgi:hypothetical protein
MKKIILKICFNIINKFLKPNIMSKNIDNIIENIIIPDLLTYRPSLTVRSNEINSITYVLTFPDLKTITIKFEYKDNKVDYQFIDTNINDIFLLSDTLTKLSESLKRQNERITSHFYILIKENTR